MKPVRKSTILQKRDFLRLLANANTPRRTRSLINIAEKNEIKSIIEMLLNILHGNVNIDRLTLARMRKCKTMLRRVTSRGLKLSDQKRILSKPQIGGFLPIIAALAAPLIGEILGGITGKHR
jgi:hypothetical protein